MIIIDSNLDPLLGKNIFEKGVCLYEKEEGLFDDLQVNALFNYIDFSPLYKIEEELVEKRLDAL